MDHFTGQTCIVSGYNKKVNNTEICIGTGFTIWTDPTSGKLHLLHVNQGLDMRHILDHTLTSPNQCRSFGVSWCNDTWDEHRSLGIKIKDLELSIPFVIDRSTALFETQTLTEDEIRDLFDNYIVLTDSNTWDAVTLAAPCKGSATSNTLAVHKMKEGVPAEDSRVYATMESDAGYV